MEEAPMAPPQGAEADLGVEVVGREVEVGREVVVAGTLVRPEAAARRALVPGVPSRSRPPSE